LLWHTKFRCAAVAALPNRINTTWCFHNLTSLCIRPTCERPLAVEGEGPPCSERRFSPLLVGSFKPSLYPFLDFA